MTINFWELSRTILPILFGAGAFAIGLEYLKAKLEKKLKGKYGESSEERIDRLTRSLQEAVSLSSQIENEINRRQKILVKLKADSNRYNALAKLKGIEVEAVVQTMRGEIQKEGNISLWKAAAINMVFFVAGIVVTSYIS